jgi:pimeloyl-ACP methyl ester carboxylesterase
VLLLHGWASSGKMWLRTMWALRHEYRLWALDLPGFGDSAAPPTDWYSVDRYTDHVAAFCEMMGINPFGVIGHSMGGRITFDLGRRYPRLAQRLVTISPTITGRLGLNLDMFLAGPVGEALNRVSKHVWPFAAATVMTEYWAPRYLGTEAMRRTTKDLRRSSWEASIQSLRVLVNQDYSQHLHEVPHPTLLICGKNDYTIPPQDSILASTRLPDAKLLMLDHIHHQPTDECPDTYLLAVRQFLAGQSLEHPSHYEHHHPHDNGHTHEARL